MPSGPKNLDFAEALLPDRLLDKAIEWISENMNPEDVFEYQEEKLETWAQESGHVKEEDLDQWALDNGYVKEE